MTYFGIRSYTSKEVVSLYEERGGNETGCVLHNSLYYIHIRYDSKNSGQLFQQNSFSLLCSKISGQFQFCFKLHVLGFHGGYTF